MNKMERHNMRYLERQRERDMLPAGPSAEILYYNGGYIIVDEMAGYTSGADRKAAKTAKREAKRQAAIEKAEMAALMADNPTYGMF